MRHGVCGPGPAAIGHNCPMPSADNLPPNEPPDRPGMSKAQKRMLITIGAVLVIALIGWLVDTLAPAPKKSDSGLPQVSIVEPWSPGHM